METPARRAVRRPQGIGDKNLEPGARLLRHSSLFSLGLLSAIVALGLSGLAGDRSDDLTTDNATGHFELRVPAIVRCGNVIETRAQVVAKRRIDKLVIAVDTPLWHQITTNSIVPAAGSETSANGQHRFSYDSLEPGQSFNLQIAQQVNPRLSGVNRGRIIFLDGDQPLAEMAVAIKVLP